MLNRDKYGIVGQIQPNGQVEGGDSACWNGHYSYLNGENPVPFVKTFEIGFGAYVRHPYPSATGNRFGAYYDNPWSGCISRDQLTGILLGIIAEKDYAAMIRLMLHHALKGFLFSYNTVTNGQDPTQTKFDIVKFFYNPKKENYYKLPDITFMDIWATQLRGFGMFSWLFWPLLVVLDLHLLLGAIYDRYFDNEGDDVINFIGKTLVAREIVPTPTSWLATKFMNKANLISRLTAYWCGWRRNCDFVAMYEKRLDKIL